MKDLSFPEKITLEREIITGITGKDVKKLIMLAIPGCAIGITIWLSTESSLAQLIAMLCTMGYLTLCYVLVARVEGNPSILHHLELLLRFQREQQCFYYKQGKEKLYYAPETSADR